MHIPKRACCRSKDIVESKNHKPVALRDLSEHKKKSCALQIMPSRKHVSSFCLLLGEGFCEQQRQRTSHQIGIYGGSSLIFDLLMVMGSNDL